ncbi:hypothetical protein LFZ16_00025 [Salmonella enterica subsp. enterica serovar India str. SA20085604]|nr:hypothetical protein LFZ16_00025 [Salmonella enterica subsp. enterica serovar India str. SA20085604]
MSSRYNKEQYRDALTSLMPKGQAWPEKDPVQQAVLAALAESCARSDSAAVTMLKTSFPATATDFLTEWEKSLGLPDSCSVSETGVGGEAAGNTGETGVFRRSVEAVLYLAGKIYGVQHPDCRVQAVQSGIVTLRGCPER